MISKHTYASYLASWLAFYSHSGYKVLNEAKWFLQSDIKPSQEMDGI